MGTSLARARTNRGNLSPPPARGVPRKLDTLVCAGWNHDDDQLVLTARRNKTTLRQWFERAAFDVSHLPDVVTAYRGGIVPDCQPPVLAACGQSWTLSQERAHYFADYWRRRGAKGKSVVVEAQIKRRYIKAYINDASAGQLRPVRARIM